MAGVTGIGGVFFKSRDPDALARWYREHLALAVDEQGSCDLEWRDRDDLGALLAGLREEGVPVEDRVEEHEYGRFAWIVDPEGNRIELWEPGD